MDRWIHLRRADPDAVALASLPFLAAGPRSPPVASWATLLLLTAFPLTPLTLPLLLFETAVLLLSNPFILLIVIRLDLGRAFGMGGVPPLRGLLSVRGTVACVSRAVCLA